MFSAASLMGLAAAQGDSQVQLVLNDGSGVTRSTLSSRLTRNALSYATFVTVDITVLLFVLCSIKLNHPSVLVNRTGVYFRQ